jgi:hypothetical protein
VHDVSRDETNIVGGLSAIRKQSTLMWLGSGSVTFCSAPQLRWAFSGTDPIGPVSGLRFAQTTFDGDACFIFKTRPRKRSTCSVTLGLGQNGLFA